MTGSAAATTLSVTTCPSVSLASGVPSGSVADVVSATGSAAETTALSTTSASFSSFASCSLPESPAFSVLGTSTFSCFCSLGSFLGSSALGSVVVNACSAATLRLALSLETRSSIGEAILVSGETSLRSRHSSGMLFGASGSDSPDSTPRSSSF